MAVAGRVYLYGIALVALGMFVSGAAGLLGLILVALVQVVAGMPVAVGESQFRERASLSGALTLIGLIAWGIHWWLAERATRRPGEAGRAERRSGIRTLFLRVTLTAGGIILVAAASALLSDVLRGLFGRLTLSSVLSGSIIEPFSMLLVAGGLELYYTRIAELDRRLVVEMGARATLRRWHTYLLAFVGLMIMLLAATSLLEVLWTALVVPPGVVSVGDDWLPVAVAPRHAGVVAGLVLWLAAWGWSNRWFAQTDDPDPEARSVLRKVYLYLVLGVAVAWTVWNLGRVLHEILRALLMPERLAIGWGGVIHDLGPAVAAVLVFGVAWRYHARVVEGEAAAAGEAGRQATIRWIYGYLVALVGLATLAVGAGGTGATVLELLVQPGATRPTDWWAERLSLFATMVVVGLPIWLASWGRLQREARSLAARRSLVRRVYLVLVFGVSVLTLLGSGVFTLYQLMRLVLGERWTAGQTSELITALSTVVVAALVLAYHLRTLRADLPAAGEAEPPTTVPPAPVVALVLVRAAGPEQLQAFRDQLTHAPPGVDLEVLDVDVDFLHRLLTLRHPSDQNGDG